MATIQPKGEKLKQAIKWISSEIKEEGGKSILLLIEEASFRFNLTPKEETFLRSFYQEGQKSWSDQRLTPRRYADRHCSRWVGRERGFCNGPGFPNRISFHRTGCASTINFSAPPKQRIKTLRFSTYLELLLFAVPVFPLKPDTWHLSPRADVRLEGQGRWRLNSG